MGLVGVILLAAGVVAGVVGSVAAEDAAAPDLAADPIVQQLVWDAADAPGGVAYDAALTELSEMPGLTWRHVHDVLARGRTYDPRRGPRPTVKDFERHAAFFADYPFESGRVRIYPIGEQQPYWYSVVLPRGYDGTERVPVFFELGTLGLGRQGTPVPEGWAVVRPSDALLMAAELGGEPLRMTAGRLGQSVVLSIVADLERHFAVDRDRILTGGYSRFGNAAWYFGTHWPDRFAGIVGASGYYPGAQSVIGNAEHVAVLAAWGTDRGHRGANRWTKDFVQQLRRHKHTNVTVHADPDRARGAEFEKVIWEWATRQVREPLPAKVTYTLHDPAHRGAYWVEILQVRETGGYQPVAIRSLGSPDPEHIALHKKAARVTAERLGKNRIVLDVRNVAELRLQLSPALFDLSEPIVIEHGASRTTVHPRPSIATLLSNFRRDRDDRRLFPATIRYRL